MRQIKRSLYIYARLISQQLKAILEYQSDFWISMVAGTLSQVLGFVFLWVLYQNIPEIQGWQFWEIVFLYAMVYFTEGFCSAFFEGIWGLSFFVNRGELDRMLVRPIPLLTQLLGSRVGMNGFGNIFLGGVLITQSLIHARIEWTPVMAGYLLLIFLGAVVMRMSIYLLAHTTSFWFKANNSSLPFLVHTVADFAKYPLSLFPAAVKAVVCVAIPFAFVSYFPAAFLFGKEGQTIGWFVPLAAILCFSLAAFVFRRGVRAYDSTGS
jgi:ABC-2 type transport system permease protein